MKTRIAEVRDIPALVMLLDQLFAQEADFTPDAQRQERGLRAIIESPEIGHILLLERDNVIFGMVNLLYTVSTAVGQRVAMLEDVVVDKAMRGQGFGKGLLTSAVDFARQNGCARVMLMTDHDNLRAHALYEAEGFVRSQMVVFRKRL
jgi:GNAT superfamily N-acetyltransferase